MEIYALDSVSPSNKSSTNQFSIALQVRAKHILQCHRKTLNAAHNSNATRMASELIAAHVGTLFSSVICVSDYRAMKLNGISIARLM